MICAANKERFLTGLSVIMHFREHPCYLIRRASGRVCARAGPEFKRTGWAGPGLCGEPTLWAWLRLPQKMGLCGVVIESIILDKVLLFVRRFPNTLTSGFLSKLSCDSAILGNYDQNIFLSFVF